MRSSFHTLFLPMVVVLATASFAAVSPVGHVFVVVEENSSYSSVIGSSSMPYLNSLASKYGLAVNYYGNTHPSIGNYFMMTTGQIITNSDGYTGTVTADNLVRQLLLAGKTWKSYAESLPYAGYIGGDVYPYSKHHNPFAYFSDVRNSSVQKMNLVPFTRLATDLQNGSLPDFSFIVPNMHNNAHDCPAGMSSCTKAQKLANADAWLKSKLAPLLASPVFQQDGLLVVVFDESTSGDTAYGGGHIAAVAVSPKVKAGYKATGLYQHQHLLKLVSKALGLTSYPGAAASASDMGEFFAASAPAPLPAPTPPATPCTLSTVSPSVTICTPAADATVGSPVRVVAGTTSTPTATGMKIYVNGIERYFVKASGLDTSLSLPAGTHRLTVSAWNGSSTSFRSTIYITVK